MGNQNLPNKELEKQRAKRKRNQNLLLGLVLCASAAAFYFFSAFPSNIQMTPSSSSVSSDSSAVSSTVSSTVSNAESSTVSSAASSESPASKSQENSGSTEIIGKIENQISLKAAEKPLWVKVSIPEQMVFVYDANNKVVQNYICSTGKDGDDTPVGTFTVGDRGQSFYSEQYQEGAYYWTRFKGAFLFHSVPFDEHQKFEPEEAAKLGTKASHGCVRLELENAKWIYDNLPKGTKVVVT